MLKLFIINSHLRAIISVILAIILFISYPLPVIAQQNNNPITSIIEIFISAWKGGRQRTSKDVKQATGSPRGGAKRGRCQDFISLGTDEIPLTAFAFSAPEAESSSSKSDAINVSKPASVWGQTIEQYPTFLFYIPYVFKKSEIEYGKFVLLDKEKNIIAGPIFVKIPDGNNPSIAKFTLPTSVKPLEINQEYNWYFSIICNPLKPSRNPGVTGWIERIKLPILPPQRILYYLKQGIWYDTITRLFQNQNSELELELQKYRVDLIKYLFKDALEKSEQEDKVNDEEKLNKIANEIASFPIQELIPVPNPESP